MLKLTSAAVLAAVLVAAARPAAAAPYEAFIDIENLDDLDDLLTAGQITPETYEVLYALLERGVSLDRAERAELYSLPNLTYGEVDAILEYRKLNGFVADPADLVAAGVLSEEKLLAITAFLLLEDRERGRYDPHGMVQVATRASQVDDTMPPMMLRARVRAGKELSAGLAAVLTRRRIGDVTWDPNRDALIADPAGAQAHLPKAYVRYQSDKLDAIAGTYRIGFGERLTFDTASDYTPNGIYTDDQLNRSYDLSRECSISRGELAESPCPGLMETRDYVTPDYSWSDGLRGIAVGSEHIDLGAGRLQAFAWGSYQHRGIYQYEIANREACSDPRNDLDPACSAPDVYVRPDGDPLASTAEHAYQTLPEMFAESLVGGNLTYFAARRDFVGLTAYGATTSWLPDTPEDVRLDTQEWSRWPIGGRFGAIGAQLGIGRGIYDVFAEITHSFDRMPDGPGAVDGGGGPAAVLRVTRNLKKNEIEVSARYFDANFVNPYSGALAAPDELEGHRGRGEHGARAKVTRTIGQLTLRVQGDLWRRLVPIEIPIGEQVFAPSYEYMMGGELLVRVDIDSSKILRWGATVQYSDKGIGEAVRYVDDPSDPDDVPILIPDCYSVIVEDNLIGEPIGCIGERLATRLRVRYAPQRTWHVLAQLSHNYLPSGELVEGSMEETRQQHDLTATVKGIWRPDARLRLESRLAFKDYDVADNSAYERTLHVMAASGYRLRAKDQLRVRADVRFWLDDRTSTGFRNPSPELWLGAEYQVKF